MKSIKDKIIAELKKQNTENPFDYDLCAHVNDIYVDVVHFDDNKWDLSVDNVHIEYLSSRIEAIERFEKCNLTFR